jgi:hypothetical protein
MKELSDELNSRKAIVLELTAKQAYAAFLSHLGLSALSAQPSIFRVVNSRSVFAKTERTGVHYENTSDWPFEYEDSRIGRGSRPIWVGPWHIEPAKTEKEVAVDARPESSTTTQITNGAGNRLTVEQRRTRNGTGDLTRVSLKGCHSGRQDTGHDRGVPLADR